MQAFFWLITFVVLLGIELATLGLTTLWFAGGAVAAFFAALAGAGWKLQLILFVAVSLILLVALRPVLKARLLSKKEATNADRLIGRQAVVQETINNLMNTGAVQLNGVAWTARTADPEGIIEKDTKVKVIAIEGVKAIVEKI